MPVSLYFKFGDREIAGRGCANARVESRVWDLDRAKHGDDLPMGARLHLQFGGSIQLLRPVDGFFQCVESDAINGLFTGSNYRWVKRGHRRHVGGDIDLWLREHQGHEGILLGRDGSRLSQNGQRNQECSQDYETRNPKSEIRRKTETPKTTS